MKLACPAASRPVRAQPMSLPILLGTKANTTFLLRLGEASVRSSNLPTPTNPGPHFLQFFHSHS